VIKAIGKAGREKDNVMARRAAPRPASRGDDSTGRSRYETLTYVRGGSEYQFSSLEARLIRGHWVVSRWGDSVGAGPHFRPLIQVNRGRERTRGAERGKHQSSETRLALGSSCSLRVAVKPRTEPALDDRSSRRFCLHNRSSSPSVRILSRPEGRSAHISRQRVGPGPRPV